MKIGVSLSPDILRGSPTRAGEKQFLQAFSDSDHMLQTLKEKGVTSIELRCVDESQAPEHVRAICERIWGAGLQLSVHGRIEESHEHGKRLAQVFPSMDDILTQYKEYQADLVINLHVFFSLDPDTVSERQLSERTVTALSRWLEMAEREELNVYFALELNRQKSDKQDPGGTIKGLLDIVERVDHPRVGIGWDMGHFYSNVLNGVDGSAASLPPASFLTRTIHTHIHGLSDSGRTHFPLASDQSLPLDMYTQALQMHNYEGLYNLELDFNRYADDPELVEKSLQSIDRLISYVK